MYRNIAVYPGTFDPFHYGHLDVIKKASLIFDELIVLVVDNDKKTPTNNARYRSNAIYDEIENFVNSNIKVMFVDTGLTVDCCKMLNAKYIVRGLRCLMDFESEFKMYNINKMLDSSIETIFIPTAPEYQFISSSAIRDLFRYGADISKLVPPRIFEIMK